MGLLVGLFFIIALCYAAAGFGGGSSYTALLLFRGEDPEVIRMVSLTCNLVVVGIGGWMSLRSQRVRWKMMAFLLVPSVLGVFQTAGGRVSGPGFESVLGLSLLVAGLLLLIQVKERMEERRVSGVVLVILGYGLGLLAGVTGIGGGIYLVPVLHLLRAGPAKEIAAVGTWFILVNSAAGVVAIGASQGLGHLRDFGWLPVAVAVGGLLGANILQGHLSGPWVRRVTGVLVLVVAVRVLLS